eukprot:4299013-Amphidinium_carterae.1
MQSQRNGECNQQLLGNAGVLSLVNKLEGPFARTLVACDVQRNSLLESSFSGSALCGERLRVIQEGQQLSSLAQSLEFGAKAWDQRIFPPSLMRVQSLHIIPRS